MPDKALSIIVLSISPSLLYLIGDPNDPVIVWKKLENHFQKSSWSNQLSLRKKLYSLKLSSDGCLESHVKTLTEIFDSLTAVGDELKERDRVIILLSSLPARFDVLVAALQSSPEIPTWEVFHVEKQAGLQFDVEKIPAMYLTECWLTLKSLIYITSLSISN